MTRTKTVIIPGGNIMTYGAKGRNMPYDYTYRDYGVNESGIENRLNEVIDDIENEGYIIKNILSNDMVQGNNPPTNYLVYTIIYGNK